MHGVPYPTSRDRTDLTSTVAALLRRASDLDLIEPCWRQIAIDARRATVRMARAGLLEPDLVVDPHDPPVVVARLLARIHQLLQSEGPDVEPPVGQATPAPPTVDAMCSLHPAEKERA